MYRKTRLRSFASALTNISLPIFFFIACAEVQTFSDSNAGKKKTYACAINCMDGKVQDAVKHYLCRRYNVDYVDMITEAGPSKKLADRKEIALIDNTKKRVVISFHHHGAKVLAIVAHHGCAGNPGTKAQQIRDLRESKKTAESFGLGGTILLLWVDEKLVVSEVA